MTEEEKFQRARLFAAEVVSLFEAGLDARLADGQETAAAVAELLTGIAIASGELIGSLMRSPMASASANGVVVMAYAMAASRQKPEGDHVH